MTTAYQNVVDNDRVSPADPFDMGAGHIKLGPRKFPGPLGLHESVDLLKNTAFDPGLIYDAGFSEYLGFLCDAFPEVFVDPQGTCAGLEASGIPTDASDLNLASIGIADLAGSQTVVRTVTAVFDSDRRLGFRPIVDAPPGFDVTVSPARLRLRSGESATYEVTFTNTGGAPIGEWAFGSLTWRGGGYAVKSPIAVRPSLFNAPAEIVAGPAVDGSTSFDVTFGYTGDYSAAAHGLVPATVTTDNVVQDPDQTFDPNDGYSNPHTFDLSGEAFFRIAMPPDAVSNPAIDLDIFVYDPTGVQVASSTSGGTNELVDILLPMDGTWTVWVHGWQTAGPSADYDMYTWQISATPGGNMSVDSAPAGAVVGETGTVDVSWTGAADFEWHLGAISHTGDVGLMGLTLIDVNNR
jgi:hypothetical protein